MTTTDSFGDTVVLSDASSGAVISTTDAHGRPVVITVTPGGGAFSSYVLETSMGPNGPVTITSYAAVGASTTPSTTPSATPGTNTPSPTVVSNMAVPTQQGVLHKIAVLGGAALGAAALL